MLISKLHATSFSIAETTIEDTHWKDLYESPVEHVLPPKLAYNYFPKGMQL